jgi:hypothetical protein
VLAAAIGAGCVAAGCGWLPPDSPARAPAAAEPDAVVLHDWKITGHVLGPRALISDLDAAEFHGRTVAVSAARYASPWSGQCDEPGRQKQARTLTEVAAALELPPGGAGALELADPIVEYRLTCGAGGIGRTPPLTLFVAGARATTCWSGVCYLLAR